MTSTPNSSSTSLVTILDDYQQVALGYADWALVTDRFNVDVVAEHIADTDALVERMAGSEAVAMRQRTPFPASALERLSGLKLLITTGMHNASVDIAAANRLGIVAYLAGQHVRVLDPQFWWAARPIVRSSGSTGASGGASATLRADRVVRATERRTPRTCSPSVPSRGRDPQPRRRR